MPDLLTQLRQYGRELDHRYPDVAFDELLVQVPSTRHSGMTTRRGPRMAVAAVGVVVVLLGGIALLNLFSATESPVATLSEPMTSPVAPGTTLPSGIERPGPDASGSAATGGTPLPDFEGALAGDDGAGPLPLGTVNSLPGDDYLDFLFELCDWPGVEGCFRDAHFMSADFPEGSGEWTAGRPFHVREGFVNSSGEPLGAGFDVVIYITPMSDLGGPPSGATVRYTSDYVVQASTDRCGPTYKTQTEPVTCEWFVHDFPEGLPAGRHAMWAVWEAPCHAWVDLGFTDSCQDPNEVISLFSSGFDFPVLP